MDTKQNPEKPYSYRKAGDTYIVSIANHADLAGAIMAFCKDMEITCGEITGLGALNQATLRFFDPATKRYVDLCYNEQMELANLTGNISTMDGQPYIHLHCVLGRSDYSALAGHLLTAVINGACELFIRSLDTTVERHYDEETGINMYSF